MIKERAIIEAHLTSPHKSLHQALPKNKNKNKKRPTKKEFYSL